MCAALARSMSSAVRHTLPACHVLEPAGTVAVALGDVVERHADRPPFPGTLSAHSLSSQA